MSWAAYHEQPRQNLKHSHITLKLRLLPTQSIYHFFNFLKFPYVMSQQMPLKGLSCSSVKLSFLD